MGLVHDEYGTFQGVVTSAILEAIVGSFHVDAHGWRFEITDLDGRIDKVLATPLAQSGNARRSELRVKPAGKNRDWTTIGVVSGIGDELIVESQRRPFVEAIGVVGFDDFLSPIVELAVADQNAEAAGGEIGAGLAREAFDDAGDADLVVRPSPRCSGQHRAEGKALGAIGPADKPVLPGLQVAREKMPRSSVMACSRLATTP